MLPASSLYGRDHIDSPFLDQTVAEAVCHALGRPWIHRKFCPWAVKRQTADIQAAYLRASGSTMPNLRILGSPDLG